MFGLLGVWLHPVQAQQSGGHISGSEDQISYHYAGSDTRLGLGIDNDGDVLGEFFKSFNNDWDRNWIGEVWLSDDRGGIKLNRHWLSGADSRADLLDENADIRVWKAFLALDRGRNDHSKMSLGFGSERNNSFWNFNLSTALSNEQLIDRVTESVSDTITGTLNGVDFIQDRTITTTTLWYEQAYDYGLGARLGRYFDAQLLRLTAGLDLERGDYDSQQWTGSVQLEKYFSNSPHSIALSLESLHKSGDFETDDSDARAQLVYRYDFGQSHAPSTVIEQVEVVDEERRQQLLKGGRTLVQNEVDLSSMAFFDLDSDRLRPDAVEHLQQLVNDLKASQLASPIQVIGHTCWLGTEAYNMDLSKRRANRTRDYLVEHGVDAQSIHTSWKGESEPLYDNRGPDMEKNRRVVINFLSIEESYEENTVQHSEVPMKWVKRKVKAPAGWIARALRNPAQHKREVDAYRFSETSETITLGEMQFLNSAPVANDDAVAVGRNASAVLIDVLANDSDADENDELLIVAVSPAQNGTAINNGTAITYTPATDFIGTDTFTYTIDDGQAQATATVTVTVSNAAPVAVNDEGIAFGSQVIKIDVLANDSDPDGGVLTVVSIGTPEHGSATLNADQSVDYQADAGFTGRDSFAYTIRDADGAEASAFVLITVQDDNQPPVAVDDYYPAWRNMPLHINLLINDSDPDGDALQVIAVQADGIVGEISFTANGDLTYTPAANFRGTEYFSYTISDGVFEDSAQVVISVID